MYVGCMSKEHRLTIRLPKNMYRDLAAESMLTGNSISSLIRDAIVRRNKV